MKDSVRKYLHQRHRQIKIDDEPEKIENPCEFWPDLKKCVEIYFKIFPSMQQYHNVLQNPLDFEYSDKFLKEVVRYCTTNELKRRFIDALAKVVYKIPSAGLGDVKIKEMDDLYHFYVSFQFRVYYRKIDNKIILEKFISHKKKGFERHF
ncbi:MAG: hypothetical protein N3A65_08575 [candidate division WOR-3 bacterium]|nr:hypothetical protein [candidate division WOR-3 bacterium]